MKTNKQGIDLIKSFEGFYPNAYLCPAGVMTIGYGTIKYPDGSKVRAGDTVSELRALELLCFEIGEKENIFNKFLEENSVLLNDNQFSALMSLAFNVGIGVITNPDKYEMAKAIANDDIFRMSRAFLLYDKITKSFFGIKRKVKLAGLTRRRLAEQKLFNTLTLESLDV